MKGSGFKKLSAQAKLLIVVLIALAAILAYYFLVYVNFNRQELELRTQIGQLNDEIAVEQAKIDSINARKKAIEEGKKLGSAVEPYDNSNTEWAVLSGFLKKYTTTFSLSFGKPAEADVYARRSVNVNFVAEDLEHARAAIDSIADSKYRNIITKLTFNAQPADKGINGVGPVSCSFTVTFLESML